VTVSDALRPLRIASIAELGSLAVLLANLVTVHWPPVSSLAGPTHGCAYLAVVIATYRAAGAGGRTRVLSLVPGIGGLLVLRRLGRVPAPSRG